MLQKGDTARLLEDCAERNNAVWIKRETFFSYVGKQARIFGKHPELADAAALDAALEALAETGLCELLSTGRGESIFLPHLCRRRIRAAYREGMRKKELPFPSEETLGIRLPPERILHLDLDRAHEFIDFIKTLTEKNAERAAAQAETQDSKSDDEHPVNAESPSADDDAVCASGPQPEIIKISLPADFGSILLLSDMIPRQLLETAILKVQGRLEDSNNKDYFTFKLLPLFKGREPFLNGILNRIVLQPWICRDALLEGEESSYTFWSFFCNVLKQEVEEGNVHLSEDLAVIQSALMIDALSHCFKDIAARKQVRELALKELEQCFKRPPFLFRLDDIRAFQDRKGAPLLGRYSTDDLTDWILKRIETTQDGALPDLLVIQTPASEAEPLFVCKTKVFVLCLRRILETAAHLKTALIKRWSRILRDYRKEAAMESEEALTLLLRRYTEQIDPLLAQILDDERLQAVYEEVGASEECAAVSARLFPDGVLAPWPVLFNLNPKELLNTVRIALPFRYSLPFLVAIVAFFKKVFRSAGNVDPLKDDDMDDLFEAAAV
ncbi:MAG: hypothetical protein LBR16_01570 [Treponema sp.]|nr:hypothetical protein [Treponema sp.]